MEEGLCLLVGDKDILRKLEGERRKPGRFFSRKK
jgi:hypothetical protein